LRKKSEFVPLNQFLHNFQQVTIQLCRLTSQVCCRLLRLLFEGDPDFLGHGDVSFLAEIECGSFLDIELAETDD